MQAQGISGATHNGCTDLLQVFLEFVVQVLALEALGQDDAIAVDEEICGDAPDAVHGSRD